MAIFPSSWTITVLASSLPVICAEAATSWAVYAVECTILTNFIFSLSRNCFKALTGIVRLLSLSSQSHPKPSGQTIKRLCSALEAPTGVGCFLLFTIAFISNWAHAFQRVTFWIFAFAARLHEEEDFSKKARFF